MSKTISIRISGSKSEANRMLILKKLFHSISIENLSNSKDTNVLENALNSKNAVVNIGHAGTAMRFLTAYFSCVEGREIVLTGSERMQERPIKILVDALSELGADISYIKKEGFPPIKIKGKEILKSTVSINGNVSSQYISALLLIGASLKNGLQIELLGKITSIPYIKMTLSLLHQIGIKTKWENNIITVFPITKIYKTTIVIESDWSSASYFYSFVALADGKNIHLSHFKDNSLQGDADLIEIYKNFGVTTSFDAKGILLKKEKDFKINKHLVLDLTNTPDIAQTIAVTCFGLGISCALTGLHTLKIKETDRLVALKKELEKFGAKIRITEDSLHMRIPENITKNDVISIKTYQDHRMAMAFAPLGLFYTLNIENKNVVEKSYPNFWKDFEKIGLRF